MIYLAFELYVIVHDFSEDPWQGKVYSSLEEAQTALLSYDDHGHLLKILTLKDFFYQLRSKKLSPRVIKVSKNDEF